MTLCQKTGGFELAEIQEHNHQSGLFWRYRQYCKYIHLDDITVLYNFLDTIYCVVEYHNMIKILKYCPALPLT